MRPNIKTVADINDAKWLATKLINLGVDEEQAVCFAFEDNVNPDNAVISLSFILNGSGSSCTYTRETCQNPMCRCNEGGFIETITDSGRMMTPVECGNVLWRRSKFERI